MLVGIYLKQMRNDGTGASGINPRVALGALIIKHICDLSDRETIEQMRENVYMQYFIGYSSFSPSPAFDPSLFVELRTRLGMEQINAINERIIGLVQQTMDASTPVKPEQRDTNGSVPLHEDREQSDAGPAQDGAIASKNGQNPVPPVNRGRMIIDATVCPQDIAYPTDLNLLNDAREKSEELIDLLYDPALHGKKPRTYRRKARNLYLRQAQKKKSGTKAIRKANGKQLCFLRRNIGHIHRLLDKYPAMPLDRAQYKYFLVIQTLFDQQLEMHRNRLHSIGHRIVSIHQPHVRPIVRGKRNAKVEFGAKVQVSLMNGFAFLDDLDWEAFNEGARLQASVEKYRERLGCYPTEVLADKIYCTRENRKLLRGLGIKLRAKPLGRPSSCPAVEDHVRPGERNPIEGVFGRGKTAYGMNRIKARMAHTSGSWIASIIMVINLVKLTGLVRHVLNSTDRTFSVWTTKILSLHRGRKFPRDGRRIEIWLAAAA